MFAKITTAFSGKGFEKVLQNLVIANQQKAILRMEFAGENFIVNARTNGQYKDITGNLRSSIGYAVLRLGEVVSMQLAETRAGLGGKAANKAKKQSQELIEKLKAKYPSGIVLICFASMEYAAAVESRGKDVITGSVATLKKDLEKLLSN